MYSLIFLHGAKMVVNGNTRFINRQATTNKLDSRKVARTYKK